MGPEQELLQEELASIFPKVADEGKENPLKTMEEMAPNAQLFLVMALLDVVSGDLEEAEEYVRKAHEVGIIGPHSTMNLAEYYALLGKKELAIETLKKAFELGYSDPYFPLIIPAFQLIRFEPEFKAIFGVKDDAMKEKPE